MKKSLIATGAASLALAAMPIAGTFANTLVDNITVTVPTSCSITNSNTDPDAAVSNLVNNYAKTVYNGTFATIGATDTTGSPAADNQIGITCNSTATTGNPTSWKITAVGSGAGDNVNDLYEATIDDAIPSGQTPITSTSAGNEGDDSDWSMRVTVTSPAVMATGLSSGAYMQVPASATEIVHGNGTAAAGSITID